MEAGVCGGSKGWIVAPILMLLFCTLPVASSLAMVCQTFGDSVSLHEYENLLFHTRDESAVITIRSEPCDLLYTYLVNVSDVLGNNTDLKDNAGWQWYGISYSIDGALLQVTLVGNTSFNIDWTWEPLLACNLTNGIEFSFDVYTIIGAYCFDKPRSFRDIDGILSDIQTDMNLNFGNRQNDFGGSYSGQHVIFIPVGAILFLVSVCCRCCYRRKKLQPVRTITVVRSVSTTDVSNTQNDLDLPPAYADVQNEMAPPPPYSEVEKLSIPPTVMTSPADCTQTAVETPPPEQSFGEETDDCNTDLVSHDPSGPDSATDSCSEESNNSSTLPKMLSSRARSLVQFSFKPLHEEE